MKMRNGIMLAVGVLVLGGVVGFYFHDPADRPAERGITAIEVSEEHISDQDGTVIVAADTVPTSIKVDDDAEFGVQGPITGAILSPDRRYIAFTMSGAAHGSAWLYNTEDESLQPIGFQYGGGMQAVEWNAESTHVVFRVNSPAGVDLLKVVDRRDVAAHPSDTGFVVSVPAEDDREPPYRYAFSEWRDPQVLCFAFEEARHCLNVNTEQLVE